MVESGDSGRIKQIHLMFSFERYQPLSSQSGDKGKGKMNAKITLVESTNRKPETD